MAIIIPSKNTYDRQNPKVRDNVIERIEVGAVEVSPMNDYGAVVLTTGNYEKEYQQETSDFKLIAQYVGAIGNNYQQFAGATGVKAIFRDIYIKIPIVNDNKAISNVFYGKSKDNENQIKSTIQYKKYTGTKQFKISYSANPTSSFSENSNAVTWETYDTYYSNSETGNVNLWSQENEEGQYKPIKYELSIGKEITKIVSSSIDDITNINSAKITKTQDGNFYEVYIKIWVGGEYYSGSLPNDKVSQGSLAGNSYNFFATAEKIEPLKVEISIYGNTIGINLQDKTVYINGETAKKVHSIDGNELLQTRKETKTEIKQLQQGTDYVWEYYLDPLSGELDYTRVELHIYDNSLIGAEVTVSIEDQGEIFERNFIVPSTKTLAIDNGGYYIDDIPAVSTKVKKEITTLLDGIFNNVEREYKNGKETATIRCSISDYYDYITNKKTIAIDKSTGKMVFSIGDSVIPMVYSESGKDRPMSLTNNGEPKVFTVLGSKIYYDGAVWQELSLQED